MNFSIRTAETSDSAAIAELSGQLGYASNKEETQNRLSEILKTNDHCVFVATDHEKVIGWIHGFYALRVESSPFVEIGGLVVDQHYQKRGVGKTLLEKVYEWAKSKECDKLRVRCNELRKESHIFYEHLGFELNKVQKIFSKGLS